MRFERLKVQKNLLSSDLNSLIGVRGRTDLVVLSADYQQIQLIVLVDYSKDVSLVCGIARVQLSFHPILCVASLPINGVQVNNYGVGNLSAVGLSLNISAVIGDLSAGLGVQRVVLELDRLAGGSAVLSNSSVTSGLAVLLSYSIVRDIL